MRIRFISLVYAIAFSLLITGCGSKDQEIVETVVIEETAQPAAVETVIVEEPEENWENIILESWIEPELVVEIMVETGSIVEESSISLRDRDNKEREAVAGTTHFGTIWGLAPGDRVVLDCAKGVKCDTEITPMLRKEPFIERTEMNCDQSTMIYSHNLDIDMHLFFVIKDQCTGETKLNLAGYSRFVNSWSDEKGNQRTEEIIFFDNSVIRYGKTVKKNQNDRFWVECCGNSGGCYYEVLQLVNE